MIDFSKIPALCQQALGNLQTVVLTAAIIVCSVISLLGVIKFFFVNKIKNKQIRKVILAFSSLVLLLPVTAIAFLIGGIKFDVYWYSVYALMPVQIVVYWLYENTLLRDLISKIGSFCTHRLFVRFCASVVDSDNKATREKLIATDKELKDFTQKAIKSSLVSKNTAVDKDLENL